MSDASSQLGMVHRLPPAKVVDRLSYLADVADQRRVVHVGFVDAGFAEMQHSSGTWLHEHLARRAKSLVGLDVDMAGVDHARELGHEAYAVDCTSADAVRNLRLEPADVVIAGEVIEHVDDPGLFLDAMRVLLADDGVLVLTTPNASGLLSAVGVIGGYEINHPDHVNRFTWLTLTNLLRHRGYEPAEVRTFLSQVKELTGATTKERLLGFGAKLVVWFERLLARLGRPFAADGLIVTASLRRTSTGQS
jgi:2-polyprenyl-3-methyl-5-hydroxy-6-metoxy-1,4-benzoquinol methylase